MSDDDEKKLPDKHKETADEICERLADGESLRDICKTDGMPTAQGVRYWVNTYRGFSERYARAREAQADSYFEDMIDIADNVRVDAESIQKARLQNDTRKFAVAKMLPKKYGDRVDLTITQEAPPLTIVFNVNPPVGEVRVTKS